MLAEAGLPQAPSSTLYIVLGLAVVFTSTSTLLAARVCHWCSTPSRKPEGVSSAPSDPGGGGLTAENEVFPSHRLKLVSSAVISEGTSSRDRHNPVLFMKICDFFLAASGLCSSMGDPHCSLRCGSRLQSMCVQLLQHVGLSCFKTHEIIGLPPRIEPRLPALEDGHLISGHQGHSKSCSSLQLQPSVLLPYMVLRICDMQKRITHNRRRRMGLWVCTGS